MPLNEIIVWVAKLDTITISWNVWSYTFCVWCSHLSYSASLLTSLPETVQVEACVSISRDSERTHLFPSSLSLERDGPPMSTPLYSYWALKRTRNCISRSASSPMLHLWQRCCRDTSNYTLKTCGDFFSYFYFSHEMQLQTQLLQLHWVTGGVLKFGSTTIVWYSTAASHRTCNVREQIITQNILYFLNPDLNTLKPRGYVEKLRIQPRAHLKQRRWTNRFPFYRYNEESIVKYSKNNKNTVKTIKTQQGDVIIVKTQWSSEIGQATVILNSFLSRGSTTAP